MHIVLNNGLVYLLYVLKNSYMEDDIISIDFIVLFKIMLYVKYYFSSN